MVVVALATWAVLGIAVVAFLSGMTTGVVVLAICLAMRETDPAGVTTTRPIDEEWAEFDRNRRAG